jgi:hypothetical protein
MRIAMMFLLLGAAGAQASTYDLQCCKLTKAKFFEPF